MNLIKDKNQFDNFLKFLPSLKDNEVYFISLSARNKYLTPEERIKYSLGRTKMFARNIVRSMDNFEYTISKLESALHYKTTNNGSKIPEHALVVYLNVNPSSMTKAYFKLQNEMNRQIAELTMALTNKKEPNYSYIKIMDRVLMNCIQTSPSEKYLIDIDCDTKDENVKEFLIHEFINNGLTDFGIIETHGGYHYLIKRDELRKNKINLDKILQGAIELNNDKSKEIVINGNVMVPLPGTHQADFLVKFIRIEQVDL